MAEPCTWTEDFQTGAYETSCDQLFECITDGPKENGFKFCCYCGGELRVAHPKNEEEE